MLLWTEPKERNGGNDLGWNCRDHAVVVGAISQMLGFKASVFEGKSIYIQVASEGSMSFGIGQSLHAWAAIESGGNFDLSIRLNSEKPTFPESCEWPTFAIRMSRAIPSGSSYFKFGRTEAQYDAYVEDAKKIHDQNTAVYFSSHYTMISRQLLVDSNQFYDSVLVEHLQSFFGMKEDFHTRAAQHLFNYLRWRTESIKGKGQMEAWDAILRQKGDSLEFVSNRFS